MRNRFFILSLVIFLSLIPGLAKACLPTFAVSVILSPNQVNFSGLLALLRFREPPPLDRQQLIYRSPADKNFLVEILLDKDEAGHKFWKLTLRDKHSEGIWQSFDSTVRNRAIKRVLVEELSRLRREGILRKVSYEDQAKILELTTPGKVVYSQPAKCPAPGTNVPLPKDKKITHLWQSAYGDVRLGFDKQGCVEVVVTKNQSLDSLSECSGGEVDPQQIGEFLIP